MAPKAFRLPVKIHLLIDIVLIVLFFALDARDLVYKTKGLGPEDSYSFTTTTATLRVQNASLALRANNNQSTNSGQSSRISGWSSFLQKCQSLHAVATTDGSPFSHVLAKNCEVGRRGARHTVDEIILASSVRVDSMAWAACKMLFHHRKPPICHSPVVRHFGHRYNMDDRPSLIKVGRSTGDIKVVNVDATQGAYSATPGTDAEMEIIELLNVIGKSSSISNTVCVEGFLPDDGPGHYTSSFFGCGSATYNYSSFVGHLATGFQQYQQNKAWLTSDMLHLSGMTYLIRENRRSIFVVRGSSSAGTMELEHRTLLNFSSFGGLYVVAVTIDLFLLVLHVYSATQIARLMLWPLWKSLATNDTTIVSRSNTKAAFAAEDCRAALTSSLYRSKPVVALIVVADLLHWMIIVPSTILLTEQGVSSGAKIHAALSTFRFWVLVLITLHFLWDTFVAWFEKRAFVFVHGTYITVAEVATISGLVGYLNQGRFRSLAAAKYQLERQRFTDSTTFVGHVAVSNAFPEHHDSLQNTSAAVVSLMFLPLLAVVLWSLLAIAVFVLCRLAYFQLRYPNSLTHHHNSRFLVNHSINRPSGKAMVVRPDLGNETMTDVATTSDSTPRDGDDHHATSPPPPLLPPSSPRAAAEIAGGSMAASGNERELRLPLEKVVDIPIRARSLVRDSWKMEKKIGHQIFLRPPQYLEHGIILQGGCLKTRCGFLDIVHPYLRAVNHAMPNDEGSHQTSSSGSSSPRRTRSFDKLHDRRQPLVPLR